MGSHGHSRREGSLRESTKTMGYRCCLGLLIRRSKVRILPGAPYFTNGYEIRLIAIFIYVDTGDQTGEG